MKYYDKSGDKPKILKFFLQDPVTSKVHINQTALWKRNTDSPNNRKAITTLCHVVHHTAEHTRPATTRQNKNIPTDVALKNPFTFIHLVSYNFSGTSVGKNSNVPPLHKPGPPYPVFRPPPICEAPSSDQHKR